MQLVNAWNKIGQYYSDRHKWVKAAQYYTQVSVCVCVCVCVCDDIQLVNAWNKSGSTTATATNG